MGGILRGLVNASARPTVCSILIFSISLVVRDQLWEWSRRKRRSYYACRLGTRARPWLLMRDPIQLCRQKWEPSSPPRLVGDTREESSVLHSFIGNFKYMYSVLSEIWATQASVLHLKHSLFIQSEYVLCAQLNTFAWLNEVRFCTHCKILIWNASCIKCLWTLFQLDQFCPNWIKLD